MSNLLTTIQSIAVNAVNSTNPTTFTFGTVTNISPLRVRIDQSTINIEGDSLILTSSVVERKIVIDKHTHDIGDIIAAHTHPFSGAITGESAAGAVSGTCSGTTSASTELNSQTKVVDTVLSARCVENKDGDHPLPVESDDDKIVVTINRALKKGDKVVMLRVSGGQRFIVLSRVFGEV